MKKIAALALILSTMVLTGFAEIPNYFNYQAVVRNSSGEIVSNADVSFRISVLQNSESGSAVYVETHTAQTNEFGLVNLKIGDGTRVSGSFNPGNWGTNSHFIKIEMDAAGGSSYTEFGTSQLVAVPYAFHAKTVENDEVDDADADPENEIQTLSISGNDLSILKGNTVTLPSGSVSPWTTSGSNIYYNSGKIGIGKDSPAEKLDIYRGNINLSNNWGYKITGSGADAVFDTDGPTMRLMNLAGGPIQLYTTPTADVTAYSRLYISKEGNIGIGTIMPQYKVHISEGNLKLDDGSIYLVNNPQLFKPSNGYRITGDNTDVIYGAEGVNMILNNKGGGDILFATTETAGGTGYYRLLITKSGRIGFNKSDPEAGLHLYGNGFPNSFMYLQSASGQDAGFRLYEGTTAKWHIFNNSAAGGLQIYNSAASTAIFAKQSNSYVGIRTTAPAYALHVNGDAAKTTGSTAWIISSDRRLKDIHGTYNKGLTEILALQPIRYNYKKDNPRQLPTDKEQVGFVAQEVQKVFPEAVSKREDGYLDFNIHSINVATVNAVKELHEENDQLKKKVTELENRLKVMESYFEPSASKK